MPANAGLLGAARVPSAGVAARFELPPYGRSAGRPRRHEGAPTHSRGRRCPFWGCGGAVRYASPPSDRIRASSASPEEGPRASTPSVLGRHLNAQTLPALLTPPAEHLTSPPGAHPSPETMFVRATTIARLVRPFHIPLCFLKCGPKASRPTAAGSRLTFPHRDNSIGSPFEPPPVGHTQ
jgi:hypothetical protein